MNCPYCGGKLEKKPTRKKKCPHCSEFIWVRKGKLYTEVQARWMLPLKQYGASEKMFERKRKKLSKQFGYTASENDTIWGMMNDLIRKNKRNPNNLERIYLLMGSFVEEEGKDPTPYFEQAMKWSEYMIKQEVLQNKKDIGKYIEMKVGVNTKNDNLVCNACRAASKRTYTHDEFLKKMPIPRNCTNPRGCRCGVTFTLD